MVLSKDTYVATNFVRFTRSTYGDDSDGFGKPVQRLSKDVYFCYSLMNGFPVMSIHIFTCQDT